MLTKRSRAFHAILGTLGVVGSLISLFRFGHWDDFTFPSLKLFLILGLLTVVEILCRAERLRRACHAVGQRPSLWEGIWVNAVGDVFGAVTPSSVGGEVSRVTALVRLRMKTSEGIKALAIERFSLLVSLGFSMVILGIAVFVRYREAFAIPSFRYTVFLYLGLSLGLLAVFIGGIRYKKIKADWRELLVRFDLIGLGLIHHLIRIGLLPLIVFFLTDRPPSILVFVWSFILGYGLTLIPIPSGGGSVEIAFMAALQPVVGSSIAGMSLLLWRLAGHYFYVVSGALVTLSGSLAGLSAARIARLRSSHPPITRGDIQQEKTARNQPAAISMNQ